MSAFLCSTDEKFHCIDPSMGICSLLAIRKLAADLTGIPPQDLRITLNGHNVNTFENIEILPGDVFRVQTFLPGGKGGFGSMLRAIGAQIEKTTNREACRDLSGRRMRDVNDEKKIADWVAKQAEREADKARRKQERLARLREEPNHTFDDSKYTAVIQANAEQIGDALQQGLRAASASAATSAPSSHLANVGAKRKIDQQQKEIKKSRMWVVPNEDEFESDEDEDIQGTVRLQGEHQGCSTVTVTANTADSLSTVCTESDCTTSLLSPCLHSDNGGSKDNTLDGTESDQPQVIDHNSESQIAETTTSSPSENTMLSTEAFEDGPLNLDKYTSAIELETVGMDRLKSALMALGLKCGGTLQQRAERLFATKGIPLEKLDASFFAKCSTGQKSKQRKAKS